MGYRSDTAVQFINQAEADRFIKAYEELLEETKHQEDSLFKFSKVSTNSFGEVTYYWGWIKFYPEFPEVDAFEETLSSDEYTCIFIRIGEEFDDIEYEDYRHTAQFNEPIYVKREIAAFQFKK